MKYPSDRIREAVASASKANTQYLKAMQNVNIALEKAVKAMQVCGKGLNTIGKEATKSKK